MEDLIQMGAITVEAKEFLKKLVVAKYNIFISGGTGAGKTTFLNILSNYIPRDERVITIDYKVTFLYLFVKSSNTL